MFPLWWIDCLAISNPAFGPEFSENAREEWMFLQAGEAAASRKAKGQELRAKRLVSNYSLQQDSTTYPQALGDLGQSAEGHIYFAAFDFAHVRAMDFADVGKVFL